MGSLLSSDSGNSRTAPIREQPAPTDGVPPLSRSVTDISNVSSKKPWIQIVVGDANIKGFDKTVFCKIVSIYLYFVDILVSGEITSLISINNEPY